MVRKQQRLITALLLISDILSTEAALAAAFLLRFHSGLMPVKDGVLPPLEPYLLLAAVVAVLWPAVFSMRRLYRPARERSRIEESVAVAGAVLLAGVLCFGTDAWIRTYTQQNLERVQRFQFSRGFVVLFLGLGVAFTGLGRYATRAAVAHARRRGYNAKRILIVGAGKLGRTVADKMLDHREYGYRVIGVLDDDPAKHENPPPGLEALGGTAELLDVVRKHAIDRVYVALPLSAHDKTVSVLQECSREGLEVCVVPDIIEYVALRAGLEQLDGVPIINLSDEPMGSLGRLTKRAFDLVVSGILLVALSPLMLAVAALVKLSSRGPVLFRQVRMGLDGREFTMYKFRTMVENAEAMSGPVFATADDARTTGVGRWLRRLSLDELPQLVNVLKGEMSLVGPRPERPEFVGEFKHTVPQYMYRHRVKAGMTGWAQVHGWRGNTSIRKRIEHDLYYAQNWTLALDVKILWMTVRHMHKNAY